MSAFALITLVAAAAAGATPVARQPPAVAIACAVSGVATARPPGGPPQTVRSLSRFVRGTVIDLTGPARLTLVLWSGRRYALTGPARVRVDDGHLGLKVGGVRELRSVPPLPRLPDLAADEEPGERIGAIRLRADGLSGLYPHLGATALADRVTLRFAAVPGDTTYAFEVRDDEGRVVHRSETDHAKTALPAGVLQPGRRYRWTVRAADGAGRSLGGSAEFWTLPRDVAKARAALAAASDAEPLLLAEIDRELGLLQEARDAFRTALDKAPGDDTLAVILADIEARLRDEGTP